MTAAICPTCRRRLTNPGEERGYCDRHGWVFIDFGTPRDEQSPRELFRETYPDVPTYDPEEDASSRPDE